VFASSLTPTAFVFGSGPAFVSVAPVAFGLADLDAARILASLKFE
jgi:hypothetical protein